MHDFCFTIPFGAAVLAGGVVGYARRGSTASLAGGVGSGLVLLLAGFLSLSAFRHRRNSLLALILETGPRSTSQKPSHLLTFFTSCFSPFHAEISHSILCTGINIHHGQRYLETSKIMPAGVVAALSALMSGFYLYKIATGGNHFPAKAEVGKTALAKLVYNDPRVQKHFELKIWVCASESLDVKQLIKEIITESGTEEKQSILTDLDSLQLILKGKMMSRRFVLVLDDVRIIDSSEWQKLYVALNHGLQGSILFVTARSLEIANQLDTSYPIFLVGLTDDVISQASDLTKSEIIRSWRALDYIFGQDDLVFSWMALGFVASQGNVRMEDLATTYFHDLASRFEGFPDGFANLINLRHIDIESNMFSAITEIGKLTSLQELPCFEVLKETGMAKLDNKEYLNELVLEWSLSRNARSRCSSYFAMDEEVLEALRPHSKLKELEIRCIETAPTSLAQGKWSYHPPSKD
uniref:Uncharacterized protein n=1 Tax=Ananas comosus var. bracteatus TaxID=296719 RepID=A0A6V7QD06_ANACO|nr:unnamed protein product [Ananas comosus var. bracteatus]